LKSGKGAEDSVKSRNPARHRGSESPKSADCGGVLKKSVVSGKDYRHYQTNRRDIFYVQATFRRDSHINSKNPFYAYRRNLEMSLKNPTCENAMCNPSEPPSYLHTLSKKKGDCVTTPDDFYREAVSYLEQFGCLHLIPAALIREYSMANYHAVQAHYELSQTDYVGITKQGEVTITSFAESALKWQYNVMMTWKPIWNIVSQNGGIINTVETAETRS
jgi:hypothetical protein